MRIEGIEPSVISSRKPYHLAIQQLGCCKGIRTLGIQSLTALPLGYILDLVNYNIKPFWGGGRIKQSTSLFPYCCVITVFFHSSFVSCLGQYNGV